LEQKKIYKFRKLALVTTLTTYFLIFVGGLVRVSGAGLGCPDWPKCFGSWIPPLSRAQLPAGFNPDTFNFTLAWIEYVNRLVGVVVGLLILSLAIMAILNFRNHKKILFPSVLAAVLVAIQGWYGSVVVATKLLPVTVSVHLVLALAIISLLIYVTQSISYIDKKDIPKKFPLKSGMILLWIIALAQIIIGTQLRAAVENLLARYPLLLDYEILSRIGSINYIHSIMGILLTAATILVSFKIFTMDSKDLKLLSGLSLLLILAQIIIGSSMEIFGLPPVLQVFHLWIASIFIGIILIQYVELKYMSEAENAQ
jgi:cytochrome c oxidase assembly protein subunit 15